MRSDADTADEIRAEVGVRNRYVLHFPHEVDTDLEHLDVVSWPTVIDAYVSGAESERTVGSTAAKNPLDPFIDPGLRAFMDAAEAELHQGRVH